MEDDNCEDIYAYLGDLGESGLIVYSWAKKISWSIKPHYFNINPLAGELSVNGIPFQWTDGLFGLALSGPDAERHYILPAYNIMSII